MYKIELPHINLIPEHEPFHLVVTWQSRSGYSMRQGAGQEVECSFLVCTRQDLTLFVLPRYLTLFVLPLAIDYVRRVSQSRMQFVAQL